MPARLKYIVCAPSYSENSGGTIFLHELVNALNSLGERALLWPQKPIYLPSRRTRLKHRLRPPLYNLNPLLDTPIAKETDLDDKAVAVYAEIVRGDPLNAKNVVRWLLYKPGVLHPYEFGPDDMFFRVDEMCDMSEVTGGAPDLFLWKVNRTYQNQNRPDRKGACYIVRKGEDKPRIPETEAADVIQIDEMSHSEINDVFNRCRVFYSYDEATMYSQFAVVCGCLSIVIPGIFKSREEWSRNHDLAQYGVAYGLDDAEISHARATRDQLIRLLDRKEQDGMETVKNFVALTRERFE